MSANSTIKLENEGWELVSAFDTNQNYGASKDVIAIFKREVISA